MKLPDRESNPGEYKLLVSASISETVPGGVMSIPTLSFTVTVTEPIAGLSIGEVDSLTSIVS